MPCLCLSIQTNRRCPKLPCSGSCKSGERWSPTRRNGSSSSIPTLVYLCKLIGVALTLFTAPYPNPPHPLPCSGSRSWSPTRRNGSSSSIPALVYLYKPIGVALKRHTPSPAVGAAGAKRAGGGQDETSSPELECKVRRTLQKYVQPMFIYIN